MGAEGLTLQNSVSKSLLYRNDDFSDNVKLAEQLRRSAVFTKMKPEHESVVKGIPDFSAVLNNAVVFGDIENLLYDNEIINLSELNSFYY